MLSLSELVRVSVEVDPHGRCEVADMVAAAWELAPGAVRYRRSSANHVFVTTEPIGPAGRAYLRFVPAGWRARRGVLAVAELACRYGRLGAAVAPPIRSAHGQLVETVATPWGPVHAMLVAEAPGDQADVDALTPDRARAWGAALGRLHEHGAGPAGPALPEPSAGLALAESVLAGDPPLVAAVARLRAELNRLPRSPDCFGVLHGDFELDNIAWNGPVPTAYDFDEAGHGWFVLDIALALRDLQATGPAWIDSPVAREFLAGYRGIGHRPDPHLAWLPTLLAAHAAGWLAALPAVLDREPDDADPRWLLTLRDKLHAQAQRYRALVLSTAGAA